MTSCRVGETDWHWLKVLLFGQIFLEVNVLFLCFVLKMKHLLWFGVINKCSFWVIHGRLQWLWYCCNYVSLYTLEIIFTPRIRTHLILIQMFAIYYCFCWHWDPLSWNSSRRKPLWATGFLCHTHTETGIELIVVWNDIYRHSELDEQFVIWLSKSH